MDFYRPLFIYSCLSGLVLRLCLSCPFPQLSVIHSPHLLSNGRWHFHLNALKSLWVSNFSQLGHQVRFIYFANATKSHFCTPCLVMSSELTSHWQTDPLSSSLSFLSYCLVLDTATKVFVLQNYLTRQHMGLKTICGSLSAVTKCPELVVESWPKMSKAPVEEQAISK